MASWVLTADPLTIEPVLKAKLADMGVDKFGELSFDQADAVEEFISA